MESAVLMERTGEAIATRAMRASNGVRWVEVQCPHCGGYHAHPVDFIESPGVRLAWCSPVGDLSTYSIVVPAGMLERERPRAKGPRR